MQTRSRKVEMPNLTQPTNTTGIVVLTQVQPIAVVFILPQSDIAPVQAAMARGPVQATVCDQSGSKQLDIGKLLAINNQADQANSQAEFSEALANCRGGTRKEVDSRYLRRHGDGRGAAAPSWWLHNRRQTTPRTSWAVSVSAKRSTIETLATAARPYHAEAYPFSWATTYAMSPERSLWGWHLGKDVARNDDRD
jgi:hypothetical protein